MGELAVMYQAASVAFVGGSLVDTGGQNVLEPAALGLPVLFGPSMYNFAAISELLLCEQAAIRVDDTVALANQVAAWLSDASERSLYGENGRRVVEANRGATGRLMAVVEKLQSENKSGFSG
jgi:3-deoxy-D-manno-octulosonic-acid transferase